VLAGLPGLVVAVPLGLMEDPREGGRGARCGLEKLTWETTWAKLHEVKQLCDIYVLFGLFLDNSA
jgi:hypothetical protein